MAQLAIKGNYTRGKEVIKLLEMLGGNNTNNLDGSYEPSAYTIYNSYDADIYCLGAISEDYIVFTLEDFEEKFPYNVGDKVTLDNKLCTIIWMCWECDNIYYQVQETNGMFTKKVAANELKPIDKTKFPYKIGTRVSVKGQYFDKLATIVGLSYNSCACMQYEIQFDGEDVVVHYPTDLMTPIITEQYMEDKKTPKTYEEVNRYLLENRVKNAQNLLDIEKCLENDGMNLPENITIHSKGISSIDFIKWYESKQYPKDYEECCEVLGISDNKGFGFINLSEWENTLMRRFIQLKRCRDAYWKIAGDEMHLNKPWNPDWKSETEQKFTIVIDADAVCNGFTIQCNAFLAFPTEEM